MDTPICKDCAHFYQHYVMDEEKCIRTYCGHCCYRRIKRRRPDTKACEGFESRQGPPPFPDRSSTMHYLTTTVLEKILALPLPPEIVEA